MDRPTVLVLGAGKCGTTTLHNWLGQHPQVLASPIKEPPFFDAEFEKGMDYYWRRYFEPHYQDQRASGESRPAKLMLPFVAERIRETLPEARLVAVLRDPVARAYSHWWSKYCEPWERMPLREALACNHGEIDRGRNFEGEAGAHLWRNGLAPRLNATRLPVYLDMGHYAEHLERYLELFDAEQIHVVLTEDLAQRTTETLDGLWRFLGVEAGFVPPDLSRLNEALTTNALPFVRLTRSGPALGRLIPRSFKAPVRRLLARRGRPPEVPDEVARWLAAYYEPQVRRLEQLLGRDLSLWRSRWPAGSGPTWTPTVP